MFFKRRLKLDWSQVRELVPERAPHAEWKAQGDEMRVTFRRSSSRTASLFSSFFTVPLTRTIVLDNVGARVWELCNGTNPVHVIASELVRLNGWPPDKTEEAVLQFLLTLSSRQIVGFKAPAAPHQNR